MYKLFRAIKHQIEKGPVDARVKKAKYTLNDTGLLGDDVEYSVLVRLAHTLAHTHILKHSFGNSTTTYGALRLRCLFVSAEQYKCARKHACVHTVARALQLPWKPPRTP